MPRIRPLNRSDVPPLKALIWSYRDLRMDLADAALGCAAERDGLDTVFTIDADVRRVSCS